MCEPNIFVLCSAKQSILDAMEHLFAKYREILPLFFWAARPIKVLWYNKPYFGVLDLVFRARKSAFSAPKICTVEAGYFARLIREPAWEMSLEGGFHNGLVKESPWRWIILCQQLCIVLVKHQPDEDARVKLWTDEDISTTRRDRQDHRIAGCDGPRIAGKCDGC